MRGLGLVAILVVICILLIIYAQYVLPVAKIGKQVKPQVQQLAGTDERGNRVSDSYTLKNEFGRGLRVIELSRNSAMRAFYGLDKGDLILEVTARGGLPMTLKETDADTMKAYVAEAYQFQLPIVIERKGQRMTLPNKDQKPATPESPGTASPGSSDPVRQQLDAIQRQGR